MYPRGNTKWLLGFKKIEPFHCWMCITSECTSIHLTVPCFSSPASHWLVIFPAKEQYGEVERDVGRDQSLSAIPPRWEKGLTYESRTSMVTKVLMHLQCTRLQVMRLFFSTEIFLCGFPCRFFALHYAVF